MGMSGRVVLRTTESDVRAFRTVEFPAKNVAIDYPVDVMPADALDHLEIMQDRYEEAEMLLVGAVGSARAAGVSWAAVGRYLGITGEAARKRYSAHLGDV